MLSIAEGFLQSSVLFALLKLRVFECIDKGSKELQELATDLQVHPETLFAPVERRGCSETARIQNWLRFQHSPKVSKCIVSFRRRILPRRLDQYFGLLSGSTLKA